MKYKEERNKHLNANLEEKTKDIPEFITNFFDKYESAVTKNVYFGYIRDMLNWMMVHKYIKKMSINDIVPEDMKLIRYSYMVKYFTDLLEGISVKKQTKSSIRTKKLVFHTFWEYLIMENIVDANIIDEVNKFTEKFEPESNSAYDIKVPGDDDIAILMDNIKNSNKSSFVITRNTAIVQLFLGSGIRLFELVNLDVDDIYINDEDKCPYIKIISKGNKDATEASITFISKTAADYLNRYLYFRDKFVKKNDIQESALFISNKKGRMSETAIKDFIRKNSNGTIHPHLFRHYVGTKLTEQTGGAKAAQIQLGHSSSTTTEKYYIKNNKERVGEMLYSW